MANHKTGISTRKLATKFNVGKSTIPRDLKRMRVNYRKRQPAPKRSEAQIRRQNERLVDACGDSGWANLDDPRDQRWTRLHLFQAPRSFLPLKHAKFLQSALLLFGGVFPCKLSNIAAINRRFFSRF